MTLEVLTSFLAWCTLINLIVLIVWWLWFRRRGRLDEADAREVVQAER